MVVHLPEPETDSTRAPDAADVEAGVIDDARARHRRERWAGAVVALIAAGVGLFFALGGGGGDTGAGVKGERGNSPSRATHQSSRPLAVVTRISHVTEFGLLSAGAGWAINDSDLYLTRDGGRRWDVLTRNALTGHSGSSVPGLGRLGDLTTALGPASSPTARVLALGFVNTHSRAACAKRPFPAAGELTVTADAGRSWSTSVLPGCRQLTSLSFVSGRVGYGVLASRTRDSQLYRTLDGGAHWAPVSRFPAPMTVSFGNRRDGLAFVTPNTTDAAAVLYRSTDGGRTWKRLGMCGDTRDPTFTVYCGPAISFGSDGAVLAISQDLSKAHGDHAYVYTTASAGRRWTRHELPPLDSPEMPVFSAPNERDLFVYSASGVLHASTNGGRSWNAITLRAFRDISQMQFVNADYGWLLANGQFDFTTDGGRRWAPIGAH